MGAKIISYSADPYDTQLSLMVECLDCGFEWGWSKDNKKNYDKLMEMVNSHNQSHHVTPGFLTKG